MNPQTNLGREGEAQAAHFLTAKGMKLLARQYQTRFGEVDLIMREGDTIVAVEVKTRDDRNEISGLDTITPAKQKRIVATTLAFLKHHHLTDCDVRFDVVSIEAGKVEWISGAFEPSGRQFYSL